MKKACKDFGSNKLKLMVKKLIKESEEKKYKTSCFCIQGYSGKFRGTQG